MSRDDISLKYLYEQGFRISAQDLEETRLDKNDSKISIVVKGRCCSGCNAYVVIPARIKQIRGE